MNKKLHVLVQYLEDMTNEFIFLDKWGNAGFTVNIGNHQTFFRPKELDDLETLAEKLLNWYYDKIGVDE